MHPDADELSELEQRLAACHPASTGLDADAMLFAAGQAAARPRGSRMAWPAIACGFAFLSVILGTGLLRERAERLALADRLSQPAAVVVATSDPVPIPAPPPPDSYIAMRQSMNQDAEGWPARSDHSAGPITVPPDEQPILHAWSGMSENLQP